MKSAVSASYVEAMTLMAAIYDKASLLHGIDIGLSA